MNTSVIDEFLSENHNVTEIVLACLVPAGTGADIHENRPSHGLAFNCDGEKRYEFKDGTSLTVKKDTIIYLPKNSCYRVVTVLPGDTFCINFQASDDKNSPPAVFRIRNSEEIRAAYKAAESAWRQCKPGYIFKCKSELYEIIYGIYKESAMPYVPESKIVLLQPAVDYIHKKYAEEQIKANTLSEICGISYEYFRRLFQLFYGCSPVRYINDLRLRRAKDLLSSGLYSASEAAAYSGFSDVSYFSRFFKKNVGMSPLEYINKRD